MFGLGPSELAIIAVIILLIFGARRLPEIGKGLGGALREFRNIKKEMARKKEGLDNAPGIDGEKGEKNEAGSLEEKVVGKVLEQVPGVRKAMDIKKKAEKIGKAIK